MGVGSDLDLEVKNPGVFSRKRGRIGIDEEPVGRRRLLRQAHEDIVFGMVDLGEVRVNYEPASKRVAHIFLPRPKGQEIANL